MSEITGLLKGSGSIQDVEVTTIDSFQASGIGMTIKETAAVVVVVVVVVSSCCCCCWQLLPLLLLSPNRFFLFVYLII